MILAGFWTRFLAIFLDGIILGILNILIGFIFGLIFGLADETISIAQVISDFLGIIISWLYYACLESSNKQATLGKQAMGIIVTDLNGQKISFARATGRYFAKYLSSIFLIGFIMAAFTEKKQGLHDILAQTLVTKN